MIELQDFDVCTVLQSDPNPAAPNPRLFYMAASTIVPARTRYILFEHQVQVNAGNYLSFKYLKCSQGMAPTMPATFFKVHQYDLGQLTGKVGSINYNSAQAQTFALSPGFTYQRASVMAYKTSWNDD